MKTRNLVQAVMCAALVAASLVPAGRTTLVADGGSALTGVVRSQKEGKMEGVLVTARADGANYDVTVVSDAKGRYTFPRTHLKPGKYALKIRAVGYDLATDHPGVDVAAGKTAKLDLTLDATKDLSSQITSVEWLMSIPGSDEQKAMLQKQIESCTYCHSLERIVKSRYTEPQLVDVIQRMQGYYSDGTMAGTEGRGRAVRDARKVEAAKKNTKWGYLPGVERAELARYIASVNRSGGRELPDLKTLPRPKGKATRVIITQYDMPRKTTVPHDSDVDSKGLVWYTDQSDYFVGRLDPKTGEFKEWPLPKAQKHEFGGGSDIQHDLEDNLWFALTSDEGGGDFGRLGKFDPKTGTFTVSEAGAQFIALAPNGNIVAGTNEVDTKTGKIVNQFPWTRAKNVPPGPHNAYEPAMDSQGNYVVTDFGGANIVKVDTKTKDVKFIKTPTPASQPRRGRMDAQDRFWFAEYTGDTIGMFDSKTETIKEWPLNKWYAPYTVSVPDRNGRVFSPTSSADRVWRLDPKTGELVGYLMPTRDFDTKQVTIDPIDRKSLWFANTRNARLVKIEPLD